MAGRRNLPQTGRLGGRRTRPPEMAAMVRPNRAMQSPDVPIHLLLQLDRAPNPITTIGVAVADRLILGRPDDVAQPEAVVDLTPYHANEHGVSRRHAEIVRKESGLWVRDLGSRNGSQLNDQPLTDDAMLLTDGDSLQLGGLSILIWFVFASIK